MGGRVISDAALNTCIQSIRRALNDDAKQQKYIRTFAKHGFQFVTNVTQELKENTAEKITTIKPVSSNPQRKRKYNLLAIAAIALLFLIFILSNSIIGFTRPLNRILIKPQLQY